MRVRLSLNKGNVTGVASQPPQKSDLLQYGELLRDELDQFTKGRVRHQISLTYSSGQEMVVCEVAVKNAKQPIRCGGETAPMDT